MGRIKAFWLGVVDGFQMPDGSGLTFDGDPSSARSIAYDRGRNFGEWLAGVNQGGGVER